MRTVPTSEDEARRKLRTFNTTTLPGKARLTKVGLWRSIHGTKSHWDPSHVEPSRRDAIWVEESNAGRFSGNWCAKCQANYHHYLNGLLSASSSWETIHNALESLYDTALEPGSNYLDLLTTPPPWESKTIQGQGQGLKSIYYACASLTAWTEAFPLFYRGEPIEEFSAQAVTLLERWAAEPLLDPARLTLAVNPEGKSSTTVDEETPLALVNSNSPFVQKYSQVLVGNHLTLLPVKFFKPDLRRGAAHWARVRLSHTALQDPFLKVITLKHLPQLQEAGEVFDGIGDQELPQQQKWNIARMTLMSG